MDTITHDMEMANKTILWINFWININSQLEHEYIIVVSQ